MPVVCADSVLIRTSTKASAPPKVLLIHHGDWFMVFSSAGKKSAPPVVCADSVLIRTSTKASAPPKVLLIHHGDWFMVFSSAGKRNA